MYGTRSKYGEKNFLPSIEQNGGSENFNLTHACGEAGVLANRW